MNHGVITDAIDHGTIVTTVIALDNGGSAVVHWDHRPFAHFYAENGPDIIGLRVATDGETVIVEDAGQ